MKTSSKTILSMVILIVLVFGLYFFTDWFSKVTGYVLGEDEKEKLVNCLNEKQAEFYGGVYCADCEKQLTLFGSSVKFLNYVECEVNTRGEIIDERCKNIREVPALYVNKKIFYGYMNFSEIERISGCEID